MAVSSTALGRHKVLVLPGWRNSGPEHWQRRWPVQHAQAAAFTCVEQDDWTWPRRGDWMARLEETVLAGATSDAPVVLLAHSLACHLVAAWAAHSRHTALVRAALLVAPPDLDGDSFQGGVPPQLHNWQTVVRQALPFRALVLASGNDPHSSLARAQGLANDWAAEWQSLGPVGHVNEASGHGDWPEGWQALRAWAGI